VFQKIKHDILFSKDRHIEFVRDGQKMDLNISDAQISELIAEKRDGIFAPRLPFFVGSFAGGSLAQKAGLKENDKLTGINDKTLRFFDEFVSELQGLKSQKIVLHFERENKPMQIDVQLDDTGKIGVAPQSDLSKLFTLAKKDYGLVQSIPAGITRGVESIDSYLSQLRLIFSPGTGAYKEVGGFGMIASIFPTVWDWQNFWLLTAMLSIMLAVLNILPIPALDGGHVMFTLYEIITRRKPSEKFLEYAQIVGMVFLLGLVVYANGMDIFRFLIK
jgi:regulator of sigma E protease